jgi:hypothetical protein
VRPDLLTWQWEGYPRFHRNRINLSIHILAVPWFVASAAALVAGLATMHWGIAAFALVTLVLAFFAQGIGHRREETPAIPFDGPVDAVTRIAAEQFVTFPRFVLTGGWSAALRSTIGNH